VSSKKEPEVSKKPRTGVSRRGFIRGVGIGSGALGTGILEKEALAEPQAAGNVAGPGQAAITLRINGRAHNVNVEPRTTLLDALRFNLDLTGAKRVCDRATCGACTVMINKKVVYACTVLAIDAQGREIDTIEGIATGNNVHPISQAFVNHDAQQCGYCTPGFVMAVKGLLDRTPNPTMDQAEQGLGGNICRCGTYTGMKKAVMEAAKTYRGGRNA
jgi:xanthine dehydrogenase YagT iron-sulfur-binding subunit